MDFVDALHQNESWWVPSVGDVSQQWSLHFGLAHDAAVSKFRIERGKKYRTS